MARLKDEYASRMVAELTEKLAIDKTTSGLLSTTNSLLMDIKAANYCDTLLGVNLHDGTRLAGIITARANHGVILFDSCDSHFFAP